MLAKFAGLMGVQDRMRLSLLLVKRLKGSGGLKYLCSEGSQAVPLLGWRLDPFEKNVYPGSV